MKEQAWAVYNELSQTIHTQLSSDVNEIGEYRMKVASKGKMPYESMEQSVDRHPIIKVIINYRKPRVKKSNE